MCATVRAMTSREFLKLGLAALIAWAVALYLRRFNLGKYLTAGLAGAGGHIAATAIVG